MVPIPGSWRSGGSGWCGSEGAGLSIAQFCREEGISTPAFYQWRKILGQEAQPEPRPRKERAVPAAPSDFTPVRLLASPHVIVRLPGGTQLDVPLNDSQALQVVIGALARADAERAGGAG